MGNFSIATTLPILVGLGATCLWLLYNAILPKPIPGIRYNDDAAKKLFGDVPEMMRYILRTKRIFCWLTSLTSRHNSPIVQAFIKPGSLPWVIVTDPYESQDILQRRTKEFDRSGFFGELIGGILPEQHIQFLSTDARFKDTRNLINHLMAPTFIREVSAPEVYKSIETLVKLWNKKCELAQGQPFEAHADIRYAALDAIFASSFGLLEEDSITVRRLNALATCELKLPQSRDEAISFPEGKIPNIFSTVLTLANTVTDTQLSPFPVLTSWILRKLPYMRRATAIKDAYIHSKVQKYVQLINEKPKSALHSVLLREREVSRRERREPQYFKRAIADEFFGFMLASHDTTATAVSWGLKYLTDNTAAQSKLRHALRSGFPDAIREKRAPSYHELSKASIPYLDATVEEILRHANTIAFVVRQALQDTTVLGHRIPRGTDVFLMANGAGYLEPNMPPTPSDARSPGAQSSQAKSLTGLWDDSDIRVFKPERWLTDDGVFNQSDGWTAVGVWVGPARVLWKEVGAAGVEDAVCDVGVGVQI